MTKTLKVVLPSISVGGLIGGGYLINNLIKKPQIKTEYIWKKNIGDKVLSNCEVVYRGSTKEIVMNEIDCQKWVERLWKNKKEEQPYIWFRTDKDSFKEELQQITLLPENSSSMNFDSKWQISKILECNSKIDGTNREKVIVTCNYSLENWNNSIHLTN